MATHWYVLRSKPHKEDALYRYGTAQGYTLYYPRIPAQRVNPRARPVVPYFPGYMFIHVNLSEVGMASLEYMPHALGLVAFGGEPAAVEEEVVEAIHQQVTRIGEVGGETFLSLSPGDAVVITEGPLAGYEAIFDARLSGGDRVRVLLTMLSERTVPAELHVGQLRRIG